MNSIDHIRAIVFDLDGTLFDTLPSLSAAANQVIELAGFRPMEPSQLRTALSDGLAPFFRRALALQPSPVPIQQQQTLEALFLEHYRTHWMLRVQPYEGAYDTLLGLAASGFRLGICSNRDRASAEQLLEAAGLRAIFHTMVCLGDASRAKPDAAPLLLALERLGETPSSTLYVGDSGVDALCAKAAGVSLAAYLGGYAASNADLNPRVMAFSRHDELASWILNPAAVSRRASHHA